ncbi:MAG: GerMN domain-containing protein [Candidatus Staskawiczbacteria bacterium]
MKKELYLLAVLGLILIILLSILIFVPAKKSPEIIKEVKGISVISPKINGVISSPLKITGVINGEGWNGFEGQVGTVELVNYEGTTMMTAILKATSDWMKLPTTFETDLNFSGYEGEATLIFHNENASGIPEKDKIFILPVIISKVETIKVQAYFSNLSLSASNETDECKRVYPVDRYIKKTQAVANAAIEELLKGPTEQEKIQGYMTSLPVGSKLDAPVRVVDGVAFVYFNKTTESGGGSCNMAARVAQIEKTFLQFPTINSVKLFVDGRTGDIFQP